MKTIKDAVIELGGKWPKEFISGYMSYDGYRLYYDATGYQVCEKTEFESEAKRLGYINGYRWGFEYQTNGKRPDLADDVKVRCEYKNHSIFEDSDIESCEHNWMDVTAFRITDQRFKPADTSYLNASTQVQSLTHSEKGLTHKSVDEQQYEPVIVTGAAFACGGGGGGFMPKSEPYVCTENTENNWHERGELPPVECDNFEWSLNGKCWEHGLMLFNDGITCLIANKKYPANRHHLKSLDPDLRFCPIRTEREKVIEAAFAALTEFKDSNQVLSDLYDAGMLVLPPKKSDTKD